MINLIDRIIALKDQEILKKNEISAFLPYRGKTKDLNFELASCRLVSCILSKSLRTSYTFDKFKSECLGKLGKKLSDTAVLDDIETMYFTDATLLRTAPEFLLLQSGAIDASLKHISSLFQTFCSGIESPIEFTSEVSFIEQLFLEVLRKNMRTDAELIEEECYLPFIAKMFCKDIVFLSKHPDYLLAQIANFVELYLFIYCSQLAVNIANWATGEEPVSQPLYFILNTEKASSERSHLVNSGYQCLSRSVPDVFPTLGILEYLNNGDDRKSPLWAYAKALRNATELQRGLAFQSLRDFGERYRVDRELPKFLEEPFDAISVMQQLVSYGKRQFLKSEDKEKFDYLQKYSKVFETEIARTFIEQRGRFGKVLVMNQDIVLLLTNMCIGERTSLRFHELLLEFKDRGFYFDKGSQQALLAFFERVGNVDRMSDSGDAVYVRNTI